MIKTEPIEKIVKVALASGRLKDEKPLSIIVIAPPEAGKTSVIRKYSLKSNNVFYTTDATAHGIIRDTNSLREFESGDLTHIVIPDMLNCLSRKHHTVTTLIHFLNALIEEGVVNISTYASSIRASKRDVKAGLITAITPGPFGDKRRHWSRIGFLSRALPVSFDYSVSSQVEIFSYIQNEQYLKDNLEKLKLPKKDKHIELPAKVAKDIQPYATVLARSHSQLEKIYGFRYQRQLQVFAKALAMLNGRECVNDDDIHELGKLANYINLDLRNV